MDKSEIDELRRLLESKTIEEVREILMKQIFEVTEQSLLCRKGFPFARIFLDTTEEALNKDFIKFRGWNILEEVPFTGTLKGTTIYASSSYWSCHCSNGFIHHRNQQLCKGCYCKSQMDTKRYVPIEELGKI